jgi:hypothetical protein
MKRNNETGEKGRIEEQNTKEKHKRNAFKMLKKGKGNKRKM